MLVVDETVTAVTDGDVYVAADSLTEALAAA